MAESSIGLKTYFEFSGRSPAQQITLSNADFFLHETDVTLPQRGITFLYGFRGSQGVLGNAITRARMRDRELCLVNAQAFIGSYSPEKQTLSGFSRSRFLSVPVQATAEVKKHLRARWEILLNQHGLVDRFPFNHSSHMHLLDELVKQEPYDQLTAIAYPVMTGVGEAQVVTVFNTDDIHNAEANTIYPVNVRLTLPDGQSLRTADNEH